MGREEATRTEVPEPATIGSLWAPLVDLLQTDELLSWPPDVFALVDRALEVSEAYRFVVSPPPGVELTAVGATASRAAREWWEFVDGATASPPESVLRWWKVVRDAVDARIDDLAAGREWNVIEALLALFAIADEACAGLGSATAVTPGAGSGFRAAARELLAETGSLSRFASSMLRVLPRCRPNVGGVSLRCMSRHVFVTGPQVDVDWHRMLSRPTGVSFPQQHANVLLLPWPLRVRSRDFRPVPYALAHMDPMAVGFFTFQPDEPLDLDLVERVLLAAIDEAETVDIVALPEAAVTPEEIPALESLLGEYGVWLLTTGVREPADVELGANWLHVGVRQEVVWRHATQHKHHRWRLDGRQIGQYHIGGALSPTMRWWEAISIPRRSLQIIDQGAVTIAPLLCEDLARPEPVADRVRSIGPSIVVTLLLDGPQLDSRWTARYATVLADDPGSAVCTLTSYGMVRRCRPPGCPPSRVVGLWKDASGELTEIELEEGAHAVLLATNVSVEGSVTADGRRHPKSLGTLTLASVQSIRADATAPPRLVSNREIDPEDRDDRPRLPQLDEHEVSKATSWAEALAEAVVAGPTWVEHVLARATATDWRHWLGLPPPSHLFEAAIESLRRELEHPVTIDRLRLAARRLRDSEDPAAIITGTLIEIALEQRLFVEVAAERAAPEVLVSSPRP